MTKEEQPTNKNAGIDRTHAPSFGPKFVFCLLHFISLLLCCFMLWGRGVPLLNASFGQAWIVSDLSRGEMLFWVACLYWLRHTLTLFYLLVRKVEWGEVLGLSLFIVVFEVGLCLIAAGVWHEGDQPFGALDAVAIALILLGSFLNTASEMQRKWWKNDPVNKGRCYTEGLFALSMHINYFGDTVLFTGWCLLTGNGWILILPLLMACSFVFYHIPGLDTYLAQRYGDAFTAYSKKTKKFVPWVY